MEGKGIFMKNANSELKSSLGHKGEEILLELFCENDWKAIHSTIYEDTRKKVDFWITPEPGRKMSLENVIAMQFTTDKFMATGTKGVEVIKKGIAIVAISFDELEKWQKAEKKEKAKMGKEIIERIKKMIDKCISGLQELGYKLYKPERLSCRFQ